MLNNNNNNNDDDDNNNNQVICTNLNRVVGMNVSSQRAEQSQYCITDNC